MSQKFNVGDRVEYAYAGDFEKYYGAADTKRYVRGVVVVDNGVNFDVRWDYDGEVTAPATFCLRKLESDRPTVRPHADLIKAWADGADVEYYDSSTMMWFLATTPDWHPSTTYRIKPSVPDPIIRKMFVEAHPTLDNAYDKPNLKLTFDGTSLKLINVEII